MTQRREIKTNIVVLDDEITKTNEKRKENNYFYLTKSERKTIRWDDFGSKLTLNHSSLVDQEKEML